VDHSLCACDGLDLNTFNLNLIVFICVLVYLCHSVPHWYFKTFAALCEVYRIQNILAETKVPLHLIAKVFKMPKPICSECAEIMSRDFSRKNWQKLTHSLVLFLSAVSLTLILADVHGFNRTEFIWLLFLLKP